MLGVALALGCCHRVAQALGRSTTYEISGIVDRTDILHLCQQPSRLLLKKFIDKGTISVIRAIATNERKF
jgi:signal-transduction protein with cAMP-binding, CBS, and nucleotidyltransferase domain